MEGNVKPNDKPKAKRPPMLIFQVAEETPPRLRRLAERMNVSASDIARTALDEKMDALEEALERGERFEVKRRFGTLRTVAG